MSKLWTLTKVLFKTNLFSSGNISNSKKKHNKVITGFLFALLIVFAICSLGVPIVFALDSILSVAPLENIIISLILPLAGIATIMFSVFSVVSVFYNSKDIEHLLPMPIKAKDIMMSKFLVSLVNEYYILAMFILPCFIGVGVGIDAGFMYYIYTLIVFLLLPIVPSVIVTFIILLITRVTGIVKNKDLLMYISIFLVLIFAIGYNFIIQGFLVVDLDNIGATFGSIEKELLPYCRMIFPFYNSASRALINFNNLNGIFSLITFAVINLIALLAIYWLGDKLYLKTLITNNGSKKKINKISEGKVKKQSAFSMLLSKEWMIIKRTPIFMLNIVIIIFITPIILLVSLFIGMTGADAEMNLPSVEMVHQYLNEPLAYLVVLTICIFFTCFSLAASTAISREGSNAWVMKVIPVSAFKQINVKVFFACVLDLAGVIVMAVVPIIFYKIPLYYVLSVFVPLTIITMLINYFNIYLDLKRPKIKWSEESVAIKQNTNGLISVLFTIAISGVIGIIGYLFYRYSISINVVILSGIVSLVCGIILALVIYLFKKNDSKLLDNVD